MSLLAKKDADRKEDIDDFLYILFVKVKSDGMLNNLGQYDKGANI